MRGIIDRFEGEYAVVEVGRKMVNVPRIMIPEGAKEGDAININIDIDKTGTGKLKREIDSLMKEIWKE